MDDTKDIYKMGLHEEYESRDRYILRVSGGWLYAIKGQSGKVYPPVFVPYNNEFEGEIK